MTIKVGEIGKMLHVGMNYDMSGSTELELYFTSPDGTKTTLSKTGGRVTAPSVTGGSKKLKFAEYNYMQILTEVGDFPVPGEWTALGVYTDSTPKKYEGDIAKFTIEPSNL